jgi:hypothetical protein
VTSKSSQNGAIKTLLVERGNGSGTKLVNGNLKDKTPLVFTWKRERTLLNNVAEKLQSDQHNKDHIKCLRQTNVSYHNSSTKGRG